MCQVQDWNELFLLLEDPSPNVGWKSSHYPHLIHMSSLLGRNTNWNQRSCRIHLLHTYRLNISPIHRLCFRETWWPCSLLLLLLGPSKKFSLSETVKYSIATIERLREEQVDLLSNQDHTLIRSVLSVSIFCYFLQRLQVYLLQRW